MQRREAWEENNVQCHIKSVSDRRLDLNLDLDSNTKCELDSRHHLGTRTPTSRQETGSRETKKVVPLARLSSPLLTYPSRAASSP